jgi:hypothetical protein
MAQFTQKLQPFPKKWAVSASETALVGFKNTE